MRPLREIEGDLFGAPGIPAKKKRDQFGQYDTLPIPERKPLVADDVQVVREAPSTADARVVITSNRKDPPRYTSAACPDCGYQAEEWSRDDCRQAYVMHRARERVVQPDLISGSYHGKLKPYSDDPRGEA